MSFRRLWLPLLAVVLVLLTSGCAPRSRWISLFDGKSLSGWKAAENPASVSVDDGEIVCDGPRAHLFYVGDARGARFRNFDLEAEVMTEPGANSGIYFHTAWQDEGWPSRGYEVQINNTHVGEGGYFERKKTGSLYGIRNLYRQIVPDGAWFTLRLSVRGSHVTTSINDIPAVDYAALPPDSGGTFALQCHDPGSRVRFRNLRVRPLPDDVAAPAPPPPPDSLDREVLRLGAANFPLVDFHVHLKGGLTAREALALSQRTGFNYGIAPNCGLGFPITDDRGIYAFLDSMKTLPFFVGMQAEGREWVRLFSREAVSRFDYVFSDAMTFTDDQGRRMRIWIDDEVFISDAQAFMDLYVDRIVGVIRDEPIDIYVNPTFLPTVLQPDYEALWTPARMKRVIDAAVEAGVAIEINNRYRIPSLAFLRRAREAGVRFTCGTNNAGADLGRNEYCLEAIRTLGLSPDDMFLPDPARMRVRRFTGPLGPAAGQP